MKHIMITSILLFVFNIVVGQNFMTEEEYRTINLSYSPDSVWVDYGTGSIEQVKKLLLKNLKNLIIGHPLQKGYLQDKL